MSDWSCRAARILSAVGVTVALLQTVPAAAESIFVANGSVTTLAPNQPPTVTRGGFAADNLQNFINLFDSANLSNVFPNYTEQSITFIDASVRGVPVTVSYPTTGTALRLQVPGAGIDETFVGATRDESQRLLLEWFRGRGDGRAGLTSFLQYAVATTPIDPVAGNPSSLMSTMTASDFGSATGISPLAPLAGSGGGTERSFGIRFTALSAGGYDQQAITLPIRTSFELGNGDRVLIDGPLTFLQTNGAASAYAGSFGIGYAWRVPVALAESDRWTLTPAARFGAVGSADLGSLAWMYSFSVTSALELSLGRFASGLRFTLGNMIGNIRTAPLAIGEYAVDYDLQNWSFRNGFMLTQENVAEIFGRRMDVSAYFVDTRFAGSRLYVNWWQEVGVFASLGRLELIAGRSLPLRLGVNYLYGERGTKGFGVSFGFSF